MGARWDNQSPFVDLPKSLIKSLQIAGLAPEGGLSPEAVTLFGLNPEEEKAISALYDQIRLRFEQMEREHFSRVEPGKNSFVVRAFPEKSAALRREWTEKLQDLVGQGRGELLDESIRTPISPWNEMRRARALDAKAHLRFIYDRGKDWLHRGAAEVHMDVSQGNPGRDGQPTYRIEYRTEAEGGERGSWGGREDQIPERWRHLLTPDILGVSLDL
jgi:hypothetical protein